ncbi:MAG: phage regulatory CII family protein [Roseateles sp.]
MTRKPALRRAPTRSVYEAFRELVYVGGARGVEEAAAFLGIRTGTLYNKADASDDSHAQPTIKDLVQLTHYRGDTRAIDALNEMFGRACFDVGRFEQHSDEALLELLCTLGSEHGEFHGALHRALQDKRFTAEELANVRAEAFDVVSALMTLVARLEGLVDEGPSRG